MRYITVAKAPQLAVGMKATKNSLQEINKEKMYNDNWKSVTISEFYREDGQEGVNVEFQYTKDSFRKNLRNLNSANNRVLVAELNMGLDSITLRDDLTSYAVLKQLL